MDRIDKNVDANQADQRTTGKVPKRKLNVVTWRTRVELDSMFLLSKKGELLRYIANI